MNRKGVVTKGNYIAPTRLADGKASLDPVQTHLVQFSSVNGAGAVVSRR